MAVIEAIDNRAIFAGWARVRLAGGKRVMLSVSPTGLIVFRLVLGGALPFGRLWSCSFDDLERWLTRDGGPGENCADMLARQVRHVRDRDELIETLDALLASLEGWVETEPEIKAPRGRPASDVTDVPLAVFGPATPDIAGAEPFFKQRVGRYLATAFEQILPVAARHGGRVIVSYPYVLALTDPERSKTVLMVTVEYGQMFKTLTLCTFEPDGSHRNLGPWDPALGKFEFLARALEVAKAAHEERS